jgi:X8 domain
MDYACGAGGAACMEIRPGGACFYPDTVISHASFAFNSYWQREKNNGGSCDFGGAAIVVSSDPSIFTYPFCLKPKFSLFF